MVVVSNCSLETFVLDTEGLHWFSIYHNSCMLCHNVCSLCLDTIDDPYIFIRDMKRMKELNLHLQCFTRRLISGKGKNILVTKDVRVRISEGKALLSYRNNKGGFYYTKKQNIRKTLLESL